MIVFQSNNNKGEEIKWSPRYFFCTIADMQICVYGLTRLASVSGFILVSQMSTMRTISVDGL